MVQARRSLHRVATALAATALVCSSSTSSTASAFQQTTTTTTATLVRTTRASHSAVQVPFLTTSRSATISNTALPMADSNDDGWSAPKSAMIGGAGVNNAGEPPFEIRGFSLGNLVVAAGLLITLASFAEYLGGDSNEGLNVSGLGFVYGIPVFLAGAALKYAEIDPVPVVSSSAGEAVFDAKATDTILKIKQDVTRHRYGDEAHLDTTVKKLGLVVPGKAYPQLRELRQDATENGELIFTMVWQSLDTPYKLWADERRIQKYATFFGPGVTADVIKIDAEQRLVGIQLTTTTTPSGQSVATETETAPAEASSTA